MPTEASLAEIETAELILAVDDVRLVTDTFKLPAYLRALLVARLADLRTKDAATLLTEGVRDGRGAQFGEGVETVKSSRFQIQEPLAHAFEKVGESRGRSVSLAVHH